MTDNGYDNLNRGNSREDAIRRKVEAALQKKVAEGSLENDPVKLKKLADAYTKKLIAQDAEKKKQAQTDDVRRTAPYGTRSSADKSGRSSDERTRRSSDESARRSSDTTRRTSDTGARRSAGETPRRSSDVSGRRVSEAARRNQASSDAVRRQAARRASGEVTAEDVKRAMGASDSARRTAPYGSRSAGMARNYRERELGKRRDEAQARSLGLSDKDKKKLPIFWIGLGIWAFILLCFGIYAVRYVNKCLVKYENSQPDNAVVSIMEDFKKTIKDGSIKNKIELPQGMGEFEDKDIFLEMYLEQIKDATITYEKDKQSYDTTSPVYDVYGDGKLIAKVTLQGKNETTLIKILSVCDWEIGKVRPVFEAETTDYTITIPDNYKVSVNGIELTDAYLDGEAVANNTLETLANYVTLPSSISYKIKGLVNTPEIVIYDETGATVNYTPDANGNVNVAYSSVSGEVPEDVKERALDNMITWQSFLNAELSGAYHGLAEVQEFLLRDSVYWNQADEYSYSPDITFISDHSIDQNEYTEKTVDNYIKYTDNCYSVHVVLHKTMLLSTNEMAYDDIDSTIYYIYYDDSDDGEDNPHWVIADMVATTN